MNEEALRALSVARSRMLLDHPFFGVLALRLQLHEEPSIPTLAVDGTTVFYNPEFVLGLSPELRISAMAHEVMHCVLDHIGRRGARDPRKWNIAGDYALNPILKDAGMPLGEGWLYKLAWADKSADEIYDLLPKDKDGGGFVCDVRPSPGDQQSAEETELEWRLATVNAARVAATQKGSLPGTLQRFLKDILEPKVPWRDVLAQFFTEKAKDDYSWRRPNPYYLSSGFYLPVIDGVGMGEVVLAIDTSGSVQSVLEEFGATVRNIIDAVKPRRTQVIYCDSRVNRVDVFERGQSVELHSVGGGGTAFEPVFEYVKNNSINPACLLYLTDMYGSFPKKGPEYPVLWCATSDQTGPFGKTLRVE